METFDLPLPPAPEASPELSVAPDPTTLTATATAEAKTDVGPRHSLPPLPVPLLEHWVRKESRSQPQYHYYFNMETGVSTWQEPMLESSVVHSSNINTISGRKHPLDDDDNDESNDNSDVYRSTSQNNNLPLDQHQQNSLAAAAAAAVAELHKSAAAPTAATTTNTTSSNDSTTNTTSTTLTTTTTVDHKKPKQVRVLHILKKHAGARRPSSWRNPHITMDLATATEELRNLVDLLHEVADSNNGNGNGDPDELRATFEELARTESDCSSAKRGGDLGFFGPKKMQPAFERAAFALEIGQLSDIVETSSGVHILLRIG